MRKVVYWMTVSLDGFVETRDGKIDWTAPDDELFRYLKESALKVGAFLHGRRIYEEMASVWPTADQEYVLVRGHARIRAHLDANPQGRVLEDAAARRAQQPSRQPGHQGGSRHVEGAGARRSTEHPLELRLIETHMFPGGVVLLRYDRARQEA